MAVIRVRVTADFEIDTEAWVAAAVKADWADPDEYDPSCHAEIAGAATAYMAAEDHLPRWARDSMRVISETIQVAE